MGAAATPATAWLTRHGIPFEIRSYEHDPEVTDFGAEAAAKLGMPSDIILKTLLVDAGSGPAAVCVVPVTGHVSLKAAAEALGVKRLAMADPQDAERATGYIVGGISPVGQKKGLPTLIDASVQAATTVLVSGGRRGLDIELAPADLATATHGRFAAIAEPGHP